MFLIYIISAVIILIGLVVLFIRMYGPQGNRILKTGITYEIKGNKHQIGDFKINNKIYLMQDHILDDFYDLIQYSDRILDKHNIPYTIAYGTLLGAVRHGGIMPWDDDADLYIHVPNEQYDEKILALKEEIEQDGFKLRKNYDAEYFHLCKKDAKNNFPYIDWYQYRNKYPEDILHPIKKYPFEDFEVCVPRDPNACIDVVYNASGKNDPLHNIVHNYPFSRYYSLWVTQLLKKFPLVHRVLDRISKKLSYNP